MADTDSIHTKQEPRRREHPHTREEWQAMRPEITRLYRDLGYKLPRVMEELGQKGFVAKYVFVLVFGIHSNLAIVGHTPTSTISVSGALIARITR
jgi:hypothetical protein